MTTMVEAAAYFYSKYEKRLARELLRAYESDQKLMRRDLEQDRKAIEKYTEIANRKNEKLAGKFLDFYLRHLSPSVVRAEAAKLQKKYDKQIADTTKQRDKLVKAYGDLGGMSSQEEKLLESARKGLRERPGFWLKEMYGVGATGQEEVTSFAGSDSPAVYKAMELATGSDDFFADHFAELGLDVDELYVAYHTDPGEFNDLIDDALAKSGDLKTILKDARSTPQEMHNVIDTGFANAYKAYIKNDIIKAATDIDIQKLNDLVEDLESGGTPADIAMAVATTDAWNATVVGAAKLFGGDRQAAEDYLRKALMDSGAADPDAAAKAIALQGQNPEGLAEALADPTKMKGYTDSAMLSALQSRTDPSASMIGQLFKDLETFNQDSAFAAWRKANGIVSTSPPGLAEFQRYNRQVNRVGSNLYRAKRTGDVREVTVVDERYAIPTRTAGVMSFTADAGDGSKKYLTGQELEAMSAEQLASEDTRYVEIDLTEDEVRERVFGSVATPEMREELLKFGKTKGFKDRARMVYDKAEGDFVILGDDLTVAYQGRVENPSALLTDVNDSRFAEPAGSARGFQANQAQNRLEDAEFAAMLALKQGEQATQLAGYLPAQRAKVATKRFMGELTFIPGQDETTFSYLTVEPDGRRKVRTYNVKDMIDAKVVTDDDEGFARYREMTGATDEATPRERRQFDRMFRPPLFGKGRQYRKQDRGARRARVKAGDVTSDVETYQAGDFDPREPVVETPEVPEETPKDEGKAKKPGGKGRGTGGIKPGPEGVALGAGAGNDILPTPRKIAMDIEAAGGGAAPGFEPRVDVGRTPPTPTRDTEEPESGLDKTRETVEKAGGVIGKEIAAQAIPDLPYPPAILAKTLAVKAGGDIGEAAAGLSQSMGEKIEGDTAYTFEDASGKQIVRIPSVREMGDAVRKTVGSAVVEYGDRPVIANPDTYKEYLANQAADFGAATGKKLVDAFDYLRGIDIKAEEDKSQDETTAPTDEKNEDDRDENEDKVASR